MTIHQPFILLLTFCLLTACTTTGTKLEPNKLSLLKKGITTEQQVIEYYGKPDSTIVSSDKRTLIYHYQKSNQLGRSVAASTASVVGSIVAGPVGSIAGGVVGGNAIPGQLEQQQLTIEIDPENQRVKNYRFQSSN